MSAVKIKIPGTNCALLFRRQFINYTLILHAHCNF